MNEHNPFVNLPVASAPQSRDVLADVVAQREIAEVQAAVILAKKFPRDQIQAMDKILVACQRPSLAESAIYSYSRGGTEITGPSIRLAEAIAQNWQNIQFGVRELEQRNGESTVEAYAWDLESNTRQSKVFQVAHKRHTKKGSYMLEDPRDIYETVANNAARRLRACILGVVPGDVVEAAVGQCEQTLKSKADTSAEAVKKMVEAFGKYGVSKEQIEKRIQRRLDSITPAQVISLRKVYNSLKDGMGAVADWFEQDAPSQGESAGTDGLKASLKNGKHSTKTPAPKQQPEPSPPPPESPPIQQVGIHDPSPIVGTCPESGKGTTHDFCSQECESKDCAVLMAWNEAQKE